MNRLLLTAMLVLGATTLRADVFSFTYSGTYWGKTPVVTGTLTATEVAGDWYTITDITGTRDGVAISDSPVGSGRFLYDASTDTGIGSLTFFLTGVPSTKETVTFVGSWYAETSPTGSTNTGNTFYLGSARVPEPETLSLLFAMGLGVWVLARKLPSKRTPVR